MFTVQVFTNAFMCLLVSEKNQAAQEKHGHQTVNQVASVVGYNVLPYQELKRYKEE